LQVDWLTEKVTASRHGNIAKPLLWKAFELTKDFVGVDESEASFSRYRSKAAIDKIAVIPIPKASTQRARGVRVLDDEIFKRVIEPLGGIGHARKATALPFVTNLRDAERADVKFAYLVIEKIF
jgi:hypothetical protein